MKNIRNSRVIPVVLVLILVAVAIAAMISLARAVFFSDASQTAVSNIDTSRESLRSSTADRSVRMTVRGPIVADEEFRSYQVSVRPNGRTITLFNGYLDTQLQQQTFGNNVPAYEEFVFALDRAGLAQGSELSGDNNDIRGICATGRVYQFEILDNNKSVKTLWTSTCKGAEGSLRAKLPAVRSLFHAQIPDSTSLIRTIGL